jgi:hypothetical protein
VVAVGLSAGFSFGAISFAAGSLALSVSIWFFSVLPEATTLVAAVCADTWSSLAGFWLDRLSSWWRLRTWAAVSVWALAVPWVFSSSHLNHKSDYCYENVHVANQFMLRFAPPFPNPFPSFPRPDIFNKKKINDQKK